MAKHTLDLREDTGRRRREGGKYTSYPSGYVLYLPLAGSIRVVGTQYHLQRMRDTHILHTSTEMRYVAGAASYLSNRLGHVELLEDRVHVTGGSGILETHIAARCPPHYKRLVLEIQEDINT